MMTHHSVITSSLCIKNGKIDKFCDFSSDIDYNSKTDVFRDVISLIINQCKPGGHKCPLAAQRKQAKRAACININNTVHTCMTSSSESR